MPGAATAMCLPRLAPLNSLSFSSVAVTAMTFGIGGRDRAAATSGRHCRLPRPA